MRLAATFGGGAGYWALHGMKGDIDHVIAPVISGGAFTDISGHGTWGGVGAVCWHKMLSRGA